MAATKILGLLLTVAAALLHFSDCALTANGANTCRDRTRQVAYTNYYTVSWSCGTWGLSRCTARRSQLKYRTVWSYKCCSGWTFTTSSATGCTVNINECKSNPCLNGATCNDMVNMYQCTCAAGFKGVYCETNINECTSNPCQNGGACTDGVNGYTCGCVPGYGGKNCQTDINECGSSPCQNGGTCTDSVNGYTCGCVAGYEGANCQTNINECASSPCLNGASCTDGVNGFTCTCVAGTQGAFCDTDVNECASSPCLNGGTCNNKFNMYDCTCPADYEGVHCETLKVCDYNARPATCEWQYLTLDWNCPAGRVPKVHAFWGRMPGDNSTCVDQVPYRFLQNLNCRGDDALASQAVQQRCDAKASNGQCRIRAAVRKLRVNGEKQDPCVGTFKYLKACVDCRVIQTVQG